MLGFKNWLPRAQVEYLMKKIYFLTLPLASLLIFFCTQNAFAIEDIKIDENISPNQKEEMYAPIYIDPETNTIFSKIRKNAVYTLDNYIDSELSSSANIDSISRKDIERQNSPSVASLLNQLGSVTVQNSNGSDGSITSMRIRGTDRVRMTIDGIRTDRPSMTMPGVETQFLLSDDIELIEVIKGPQGNILGTNASGGAVNIQTRRGEGPFGFEAASEMGKYGTFKERAAIMGGNEKADYYLSTTWYKTNGAMRTKNMGRIFNDSYENLSTVLNSGLRLLDNKAELRNVFRFSNAEKGLGIGYSNLSYKYYNDPNNYMKNTDVSDSLSFKHSVNDIYNYGIRFGLYHNKNNNYTLPDSAAPDENSISKIDSTRLNFMTQHDIKYKDINTLSIGYNLENEYIDGNSSSLMYGSWNMFPLQKYNSGYSGSALQNDVYVNDVVNIKDTFYLRGGARLVNNNEYGTYVSPNGSAALVLPTFKLNGAKTKFRSSWGRSVNTPTLYQRYGGFRDSWMAWSGNKNLDAEKLTSWDLGIEQNFMDEKLKFEFGYFNSKYKDYISDYYVIDPVTYYTSGYYDNIDSAKIQGYEGKITYEPNDKFKILVNYTYTDSKDKSTGFALPATPKNRINGTLYWTPNDRLSLYAGIETASSRTLSSGSKDKVSGYVDAKIGTQIKLFSIKDVDFYARGNIYNLFNQDICMYKNTLANDYYYSPKIRFNTGLFIEYAPGKKLKERV